MNVWDNRFSRGYFFRMIYTILIGKTKTILNQENWWVAKGLVIHTKLFNLRAAFRIFIDPFSSL
jgi:hypothetical protein